MRILLLLALAGLATGQDETRRPNIVLIFSDDAGYADFGFQPDVRADAASLTPHIDSIAAAGARLTSFYVSGCVCSPSRAGLLTGRYQQRFGHEQNIPPGYKKGGMSLEETTVADRLSAAGYATGIVGKWHLGYPPQYHPNERGFDFFYGCLQGSRSYFPYDEPTPHRVIQENGEPTKEEGYVTDRLGDAAVRFVREHKAEPFFLFLSFTAPHGPLQAKPEDLEALASIEKQRRRKYAGLVKAMDDNVGKLLAALREEELVQDTIVVFTNDNGGQTGTGANNAPLRGKKGTLWEGGVRVPFCVRWPGVVAPASVIDEPVIALDLLPTFVAAAGGELDGGKPLDGTSLVPLLAGEADALGERAFFWRKGGSQGPVAMRFERWKLVRPARDVPAQLFDLSADIGEASDLAQVHPERTQELLGRIAAWEKGLIEPLWGTKW
ncbi:MAG: sulfatase [bacterium]|nr:sulfatase [bacterium]